ncbi:MAG: hypothetical protein ABJB74_05980 [Gemmatimonas sp.]
MARARPKPIVKQAPPVAVEQTQFDMFPERPEILRLNPRAFAGQQTSIAEIVRVRMRSSEPPHLIFHDRHGWYCETHGVHCAAVALAQELVERGE